MTEPETVEFVLDGTVAGQPVSASAGVPFLRFQEFNDDVQRYVQGSDDKAVLRDLSVQVREGSYLLRVLIPAGLLSSLVTDTARLAQANGISERIAEAAIKEWWMKHGGDFDWNLEDVKAICLRNKARGIPPEYLPEAEKR